MEAIFSIKVIPFQTDIPAIQKQREKLKRLVLDRDASQQNYTKAQKALNGPGPNPPQAAANVETLREKYDQAVTRMEQCKVGHVLKVLKSRVCFFVV